jgi:hypothetical protein
MSNSRPIVHQIHINYSSNSCQQCVKLNKNNIKVDADNVDEANPDLATSEYGEAASNIDPSVDLSIELDSGDMIDINEDTNIFLTIDIDPFLVIDSYVDYNS